LLNGPLNSHRFPLKAFGIREAASNRPLQRGA
jgi:hypothetical protein